MDDKKAIIGKGYGLLPELESEEDTFLGWSLTKGSSDIVKTTDLVEKEKVVLYAVWKNHVQEEKPSEEEPDGQPTLLPSDSTDENLSEKDYIEIRTAEELSKIRENLSGNYRLMEDIDLSVDSQVSGAYDLDGYGWRPIGSSEDGSSQPFTGIFDGNGHVIKGIVIKGEVPYKDVGLFARLEGGTIKDITVEQASIEIGGKAVRSGIIVGYTGQNEDTDEKAVIHNCSTVGGEIKFIGEETIASNNITIGGITGYMGAGTLSDSSNSAKITYYSNVQEKPDGAYSRFLGGISGYLEEGSIEKCRNTGTIDAFRNYYGDFTDATPGDVVEQALAGLDVYTVTGGICGVGSNDGNISECFNTGDVKAYVFNDYTLFTLNVTTHVNTMAGGICGARYRSTAVENCYNAGSVYSYADRNTTLVDKNASSESMIDAVMALLDKYTLQAPFQNAKGYAAGIVGYSTKTTSGPVKYCYNTGSFKGSEGYVHAIANGKVPVAYCRYKDETITNADGAEEKLVGSGEYEDSLSRCMAIDKDKMNLCEMYRGFDFANVWFLVDGSVMEAPQLYSNMVSEVTKAEFLEVKEGTLKTAYEYGEKLDLTGLKVSVTLKGIEEPLVFDVPSNIQCGYDAYTSGKQTLSITYFGASKEIEVTVNKQKFPVVVNGGEGSGKYCEGTVVSISAPEPEEGISFTGWVVDSGDVTIEDPAALETTFVMGTSAVEVTAVYEDMYCVTINNGEGSGYYKVGETVTVKAADPAEAKYFSKWKVVSGSVSLADATSTETTFVMPKKAVEVTAVYEDMYYVTIDDGEGSGYYKPGETVTIKAADPAEGELFSKWKVVSGAVSLNDATLAETTFVMPKKAVEVTAMYETITTEEVGSTETSTTEKVVSTEAVTTEKVVTTEAVTTEKVVTTEAATTEKVVTTEAATTEKVVSTEAATTEKAKTTEAATTEKAKTTEAATTEKAKSTEADTTNKAESTETDGNTVGALYTDTKAKVSYKITGTKTVEYCKSTNAKAKSISIPSDVTINGKKYQVTSVASNAFNANKKITKVVIGKNVKSIGENAFKNCTKLKTVEMKSKTLNKIAANAFSGNKNLAKITLKTTKLTKKSIGKNAFKGTNKKLVIKVPKQQLNEYKGYFKGKGSKTVKVKS